MQERTHSQVNQQKKCKLTATVVFLSSKMINHAVSRTIDERVLNRSPSMNTFQMTENNNLVIQSAKAIGCSVVNIGSQDIIEGREHLVLGLVWQIIKIGLFAKVSLSHHPELFRLLREGEVLEELLRIPPDALLLRWVNYHLEKTPSKRRIANFSSDIKVEPCRYTQYMYISMRSVFTLSGHFATYTLCSDVAMCAE